MGFIIFTHTCINVLSSHAYHHVAGPFRTHSYVISTPIIRIGKRKFRASNVFTQMC